MNLKPMGHDILLILRVYMFKIIESNERFYINDHDGLNESSDPLHLYNLMKFLYINYHDMSTTMELEYIDTDSKNSYDYHGDTSIFNYK